MREYQPYSIIHLDITGIDTTSVPQGAALCYIWWRDIPLGHLWIGMPANLTLQDFRSAILEQVTPALRYYGVTGSWEDALLNGDNEGLKKILSTQLTQQLLTERNEIAEPVSIVICTRNRAPFLATCIDAILKNSDQNFELIVVDNAPDDDLTKNVVAQYPKVKYVLEPRKGLDIARNTGARNATNNIIAYTDDDVIVENNWIKKLKQCFGDPKVLAVTGQVIPVELATRSQYIFERYWGFNKGYVPRTFDYKYFTEHLDNSVPVWNIGAGANMAFRKDAFDIAGWFDERLDVGAAGCSGDSEFWYRILAERWNCFYCPQLFVFHNHRATEKALTNQIFNYMRGQVTSLYVQYENYGHKGNLLRIRKILPTYYYHKIKSRIARGYTEDFGTIPTEIKGCIAGLFYYRQAKHNNTADIKKLPPRHITWKKDFALEEPLVSVIITCYNYGKYLAQAINSVLSQTWKNTEIIVVDDGSTDDTQEILKKYANVVNVVTQRVGASAARNIGISYSKGDLLLFLDADDYLYPEAVARNISFFRQHPECAFVSGAFDKIDDAGQVLPSPEPREHLGNYYMELLRGNHIGMLGNVLYRRELFFTFHFDTSLKNCEDYDLNLRITKHYPSCSHTTRIIAYRQHPGNKSGNAAKMYATIKKILMRQYAQADSPGIKKTVKEGFKIWNNYYNRGIRY